MDQVIALRPAGRRLVPVLASLADANDAETFGHLSDDQRRMLRTILETLVDRLELRGTPVA